MTLDEVLLGVKNQSNIDISCSHSWCNIFTVIISLPAFSSVSLNSIQLMIEWKWNERREKATAIHIHSVRSIIQSISPFHWRIEVELISVTPFTSASSCVTFRSISFRLFIADWNELKLIALISLRVAFSIGDWFMLPCYHSLI